MSDPGVAVVIEDDPDVRNLVAAVLKQSGFDVHMAPDGRTGVELVRKHEATVATIDVGLPDIDGYEVAERIRRFSVTFIIMLTARVDAGDQQRGYDAGADRYLTKPFRPAELRRHLQEGMAPA